MSVSRLTGPRPTSGHHPVSARMGWRLLGSQKIRFSPRTIKIPACGSLFPTACGSLDSRKQMSRALCGYLSISSASPPLRKLSFSDRRPSEVPGSPRTSPTGGQSNRILRAQKEGATTAPSFPSYHQPLLPSENVPIFGAPPEYELSINGNQIGAVEASVQSCSVSVEWLRRRTG